MLLVDHALPDRAAQRVYAGARVWLWRPEADDRVLDPGAPDLFDTEVILQIRRPQDMLAWPKR